MSNLLLLKTLNTQLKIYTTWLTDPNRDQEEVEETIKQLNVQIVRIQNDITNK